MSERKIAVAKISKSFLEQFLSKGSRSRRIVPLHPFDDIRILKVRNNDIKDTIIEALIFSSKLIEIPYNQKAPTIDLQFSDVAIDDKLKNRCKISLKTKHDDNCSIYTLLINGKPEDGICTCGYGKQVLMRDLGNFEEMYSQELKSKLLRESKNYYTMRYRCGNCGFSHLSKIPKGQKPYGYNDICPNCGYKDSKMFAIEKVINDM